MKMHGAVAHLFHDERAAEHDADLGNVISANWQETVVFRKDPFGADKGQLKCACEPQDDDAHWRSLPLKNRRQPIAFTCRAEISRTKAFLRNPHDQSEWVPLIAVRIQALLASKTATLDGEAVGWLVIIRRSGLAFVTTVD
jgi:hypothetical protein